MLQHVYGTNIAQHDIRKIPPWYYDSHACRARHVSAVHAGFADASGPPASSNERVACETPEWTFRVVSDTRRGVGVRRTDDSRSDDET